jgi:hypothetical protein
MNLEPDMVLFLYVHKHQAGKHEPALGLVGHYSSEEIGSIDPTTRYAENSLDDLQLLGHSAAAEG